MCPPGAQAPSLHAALGTWAPQFLPEWPSGFRACLLFEATPAQVSSIPGPAEVKG